MEIQKIKDILREANVKQADIARKLEISRTTVHQVIHKKSVSFRVMTFICAATGKTYDEIWL